jgi:hypothetical protein
MNAVTGTGPFGDGEAKRNECMRRRNGRTKRLALPRAGEGSALEVAKPFKRPLIKEKADESDA